MPAGVALDHADKRCSKAAPAATASTSRRVSGSMVPRSLNCQKGLLYGANCALSSWCWLRQWVDLTGLQDTERRSGAGFWTHVSTCAALSRSRLLHIAIIFQFAIASEFASSYPGACALRRCNTLLAVPTGAITCCASVLCTAHVRVHVHSALCNAVCTCGVW